MENFDSKIISLCQRNSSIRNGVAHSSPHRQYILSNKLKNSELRFVIEVMNSSGVIKTKNLDTEYDDFLENHRKIIEYLKRYIDNLEC